MMKRAIWVCGVVGVVLGAVGACNIGSNECHGDTSAALMSGGGGTGGTGGQRANGVGGDGGNLCAHFGQDCAGEDGAVGKVGAKTPSTCTCCTGCLGQIDGRCQSGTLTIACGHGGVVCGDCQFKGCGNDGVCYPVCVDPDTGILLPNGTACTVDGGPGACFSGLCMPG